MKIKIFAAIFLILAASIPALAATYYVDGRAGYGNDAVGGGSSAAPWKTITYAKNNSAADDTIYVRPATYIESISFSNRHLIAETALAATIEGLASLSSVDLDGTSTLNGFYVKRTSGGIATSAVVHVGDDTGFGASYAVVKNNIIDGTGYYSVTIDQPTYATIESNVIFGAARGIYVNSTGTANSLIKKNEIRACTDYGIYVSKATTLADRNTLYDNTVGFYGDNPAAVDDYTITVKNNIINELNTVGTVGIQKAGIGGTLNSSYNNLYNNQTPYSGTVSDKNGDITTNPTFVNLAGNNFNLLWGSPCIDTGDSTTEKDPDGSPADMGAYYFNHNPTVEVTAPTGLAGDTVTANSTYNITWTATNPTGGTIDHVDIHYKTEVGGVYSLIAASETNDGTCSWSVPFISTNAARVRIGAFTDAAGTYSATDESAVFTISPTTTTTTTTTTVAGGTTTTTVAGGTTTTTVVGGIAGGTTTTTVVGGIAGGTTTTTITYLLPVAGATTTTIIAGATTTSTTVPQAARDIVVNQTLGGAQLNLSYTTEDSNDRTIWITDTSSNSLMKPQIFPGSTGPNEAILSLPAGTPSQVIVVYIIDNVTKKQTVFYTTYKSK